MNKSFKITLFKPIITSPYFYHYCRLAMCAEPVEGGAAVPITQALEIIGNSNFTRDDLIKEICLPPIYVEENNIIIPHPRLECKDKYIFITKDTLEYIYERYGTSGVKVYCHFRWLDNYQKAIKTEGTFYYSSINTMLGIRDASQVINDMAKDNIMTYIDKSDRLKALTYIDPNPEKAYIAHGVIYSLIACQGEEKMRVIEVRYSPLTGEEIANEIALKLKSDFLYPIMAADGWEFFFNVERDLSCLPCQEKDLSN